MSLQKIRFDKLYLCLQEGLRDSTKVLNFKLLVTNFEISETASFWFGIVRDRESHRNVYLLSVLYNNLFINKRFTFFFGETVVTGLLEKGGVKRNVNTSLASPVSSQRTPS